MGEKNRDGITKQQGDNACRPPEQRHCASNNTVQQVLLTAPAMHPSLLRNSSKFRGIK